MKRLSYYLGWTIVIGFIIYAGARYQLLLQQKASANFTLMPIILYSFIFSIVIGILLRLPGLINEIKRNKQWTFDWIKFVAVGLPSFVIALFYVVMYYLPEGILSFVPQAIFLVSPTIQMLAGGVFGFILLDCLKK